MKKKKNYYDGLAADYSFPVPVDKKRADKIIKETLTCFSRTTGEVTGKGNAVFLRRGHVGGIHVKVEQLTFFRDCHEKFFSQVPG